MQFELSRYFLQTYKVSKDYEFCASFPSRAVSNDNSPAKKKGNVKDGAVQVDKLEEEHFQGKAVLPFRFSSRVLCGKTQYTLYKQKLNGVMPNFAHTSINQQPVGFSPKHLTFYILL